MKKAGFLIGSIVLILFLAGCNQNNVPVAGDSLATTTPFELGTWLDTPENYQELESIEINIFPETWQRDVKPIGTLTANTDDQEYIINCLRGIYFIACEPVAAKQAYDFALIAAEPLMFFTFTDEALIVKVANAEGGYFYYQKPLNEDESLYPVKDLIAEKRLAYYAENNIPQPQ